MWLKKTEEGQPQTAASKPLLEKQFEVLWIFFQETGQITGTVSGQMAEQALILIAGEVGRLNKRPYQPNREGREVLLDSLLHEYTLLKQNAAHIRRDTLEWAAKWIEGSLVGEEDARLIEFCSRMAMSIRAAKGQE